MKRFVILMVTVFAFAACNETERGKEENPNTVPAQSEQTETRNETSVRIEEDGVEFSDESRNSKKDVEIKADSSEADIRIERRD